MERAKSRKVCAQERYVLVTELAQEGNENVANISATTGISRPSVMRYLEMWHGGVPLTDVRGIGRIPKITPQDHTRIGNCVQKTPHCTVSKLQDMLVDKSGIQVSSRTVRRHLSELGYKSSQPRYVPLLTNAHIDARMSWCREHTPFDWNAVLFSDETSIQTFSNAGREWHKIGCRPIKAKTAHPLKVMFWAAISLDTRTPLIEISGHIDSNKYMGLIGKELLPWIHKNKYHRRIFQQDNAPAHTSRATTAFFAEKNLTLLRWPANSPDLNPIENLWGILKASLSKQQHTSKQGLIDAAKREWMLIPQKTIRNCFLSMPKRIEQVLERGGLKCDY
jgi:transposase